MQVLINTFYNEDGKLNDKVTKALEDGIQALVTNVLDALPHSADQPFVSQLFLRQVATSRLDLAFAMAFVEASIKSGQGSTRPTTYNPLKILEDDIDTAFEKAEDGQWDGEHAHDMLQVFSSMIEDAKKGQSYFSDDDDDYSVNSEGDGEYPYGANAK